MQPERERDERLWYITMLPKARELEEAGCAMVAFDRGD